MLINNTPVRTCKNYKINNIDFEDIPNIIQKFDNVNIFKETEKDEVIENFEFEDFNIKYGTGLENQIKENANQKLKINVNSKTNKEIRIEFNFDEKNENLVDYIEMVGNENTTSNIYIIYKNSMCESSCEDVKTHCNGIQCTKSKSFHNGLIKVLAKKNSKVVVNIINLLNNESSNILSIDGKTEENSKIKYNIIDFGGKTSITNLYTNLEGKESNSIVNSIYLGSNDEKIDINYIAECFGEKSKININVQGALKDNAIKKFKGTIDFKKGCKKASRK